METLGQYALVKDQAGAPIQIGRRRGRIWRKAFNNRLRCYAAVTIVPAGEFTGEQSRAQFVREVQIASAIRHRNVATVFPLEIIEDNYVYATEFGDGATLADYLQRTNRLETLDSLIIANQVAAALEAASSAGLVHAAITSDCVVLQEEEDLFVKVLGLALPTSGLAGQEPIVAAVPDFRSPEEVAGKSSDVRSAIYSLGCLVYWMTTGADRYPIFRARLLPDGSEDLVVDQENISQPIAHIVAHTVRRDPQQRPSTYTEVIDIIEEARALPDEPRAPIAPSPTVEEPEKPVAETAPATPVVELAPPTLMEPGQRRAGELIVPSSMLGVARPGTVLRLTRTESNSLEQIVARVGDVFRIGRSVDADLVARFLPRNKTNDARTKRLSKIHLTIRYDNSRILLADGSGAKPSANGSLFNGKALSVDDPITLSEAGELKLAGEYLIQVGPLLESPKAEPAIVNLREWVGPSTIETPRGLTGAVFFRPAEQEGNDLTLWLFSTTSWGQSSFSPMDFTLPAEEPKIGTLHYLCGCFWIEQMSSESLLLDGVALAPGEIAPLSNGQVVEVKGTKYVVEVREVSKGPKS